MAAPPPVAIGTRGTVGSLVRKEIEYFTMSEFERRGCCSQRQPRRTPHPHVSVDMVSGNGHSGSGSGSGSCCRSSFWVLLMTWKRKKRRSSCSSTAFLPKICSVAEVADTTQLDRIPGYSYRILNNDIHNLHI